MKLTGQSRFPDKTPNEAKWYGVDWVQALDSASISTVSFTASGLTLVGGTVDPDNDSRTVVKVSGGSAGTDYVLVSQITTSNGETLEVSGPLKVR